MKSKIWTDSVPTLESIASLKGVEHKEMSMELRYLTDKLEDGSVSEYSWVCSEDQLADFLTKRMREPATIRQIFFNNEFDRSRNLKNKVLMGDIGVLSRGSGFENLLKRLRNPSRNWNLEPVSLFEVP